MQHWRYLLYCIVVLAVLVALMHGGAAPANGPIHVTYIANQGVLLEGGGKKVVIDAMFRRLAGYAYPVEELRADMEAARAAFANVDLVLATHVHADHFDAGVVGAHLAANQRATFVAVQQVTEALAKGYREHSRIAARVQQVTPNLGTSITFPVSDVPLRVLRLRHGNTMNAGFLVDLGGTKVLHLGDADGTAANFDTFDLENASIDVALVPYWYALDDEGRRVIREHIAPKRVVFFHIAEDNPDDAQLREHMRRMGGRAGLVDRIRKEFPDALFLLEPLSRFTF
ncbi:MAG: MBL fold metallo-hydrolase [Candidatus Acidiferrales bacterium]